VTNFDPGGVLVVATVLPSAIAGVLSIGGAHIAARLGVADYDTTVVTILAVLTVAWVVTAVLVSTSLLQILGVGLTVVGAYAVTRSVRATSYAWVLGVVLFFAAFVALSVLGVYQGVDQRGRPQDPLARNLAVVYYGGVLAFGVIGGAVVRLVGDR